MRGLNIKELFIYVSQYLYNGGIILIPLAGCCFYIFYIYLHLRSCLINILYLPKHFPQDIQEMISSGEKWDSINNYLSNMSFSFAFIVKNIINMFRSNSKLSRIFDNVKKHELDFYQRELLLLNALIAAAPLMGLLGTIWGMVKCFQVLAYTETASIPLIADGIKQALITTQFGLLVALPGLLAVANLKKKIKKLDLYLLNLEMHMNLGIRGRKNA